MFDYIIVGAEDQRGASWLARLTELPAEVLLLGPGGEDDEPSLQNTKTSFHGRLPGRPL